MHIHEFLTRRCRGALGQPSKELLTILWATPYRLHFKERSQTHMKVELCTRAATYPSPSFSRSQDLLRLLLFFFC